MTNSTDTPPANALEAKKLPSKRATRIQSVLAVVLFTLAIAVLFYQGVGGIHLPAKPDHIGWQTDYSRALAQSKATGKLVLLDFGASWCPLCVEMKRTSWPDEKVQQLVKEKYIAVFLDMDQPSSDEAKQRYANEAELLPSVLIVDADGKVLRQGDYLDAKELAEFLTKGATPHAPTTFPQQATAK